VPYVGFISKYCNLFSPSVAFIIIIIIHTQLRSPRIQLVGSSRNLGLENCGVLSNGEAST